MAAPSDQRHQLRAPSGISIRIGPRDGWRCFVRRRAELVADADGDVDVIGRPPRAAPSLTPAAITAATAAAAAAVIYRVAGERRLRAIALIADLLRVALFIVPRINCALVRNSDCQPGHQPARAAPRQAQ